MRELSGTHRRTGPMNRAQLRLATGGLLILAVGARVAFAEPRCAMPCKEETARCRQTRCAGLEGRARRDCVETCRGIGGCASIRTLAYVVSEWRTDSPVARQVPGHPCGNCPSVTVMELQGSVPPDQRGAGAADCREFGVGRRGADSVVVGFFQQRLSVTPDGSGVVFEVTDGVTHRPGLDYFTLPDGIERGFYFVRAD